MSHHLASGHKTVLLAFCLYLTFLLHRPRSIKTPLVGLLLLGWCCRAVCKHRCGGRVVSELKVLWGGGGEQKKANKKEGQHPLFNGTAAVFLHTAHPERVNPSQRDVVTINRLSHSFNYRQFPRLTNQPVLHGFWTFEAQEYQERSCAGHEENMQTPLAVSAKIHSTQPPHGCSPAEEPPPLVTTSVRRSHGRALFTVSASDSTWC